MKGLRKQLQKKNQDRKITRSQTRSKFQLLLDLVSWLLGSFLRDISFAIEYYVSMQAAQRYAEIDVLRTIAIILMILYHTLFDLQFLFGYALNLDGSGWMLFQRLTAGLFLLLVGISFSISHQRLALKQAPNDIIWKKFLQRGLTILFYGLIISLVTYLFDAQTYVRFGVLHLIGVSICLLPAFAQFKETNALLGIAFIIFAQGMSGQMIDGAVLLPFGITYTGFASIDYFPLVPWFGVILIGAAIGHFLYVRSLEWRTAGLNRLCETRWMHALGTPGRYSLLLYLIHQPIVLGILFLLHR